MTGKKEASLTSKKSGKEDTEKEKHVSPILVLGSEMDQIILEVLSEHMKDKKLIGGS